MGYNIQALCGIAERNCSLKIEQQEISGTEKCRDLVTNTLKKEILNKSNKKKLR